MVRYELALKKYAKTIDNDLGLTKNKMGFIVMIVREDEEDCVDIASNLCDKHIANALRIC